MYYFNISYFDRLDYISIIPSSTILLNEIDVICTDKKCLLNARIGCNYISNYYYI